MNGHLLDTHAVLFWWSKASTLGPRARAVIADGDAPLFVSAVTALEIATKFRIGKLPDIGDPALNYRRLMDANGFIPLAVTEEHAMMAGLLAGDHRDPFDRLIAAQSLIEAIPVITRDPALARFGCEVVW